MPWFYSGSHHVRVESSLEATSLKLHQHAACRREHIAGWHKCSCTSHMSGQVSRLPAGKKRQAQEASHLSPTPRGRRKLDPTLRTPPTQLARPPFRDIKTAGGTALVPSPSASPIPGSQQKRSALAHLFGQCFEATQGDEGLWRLTLARLPARAGLRPTRVDHRRPTPLWWQAHAVAQGGSHVLMRAQQRLRSRRQCNMHCLGPATKASHSIILRC